MSLENSVLANPPSLALPLAGLANNESGEDAKEREPFFFEDDEDTQEYDPDFGKKAGRLEEAMEESKGTDPAPDPTVTPEETNETQPMNEEPLESEPQPIDSQPPQTDDTQPLSSQEEQITHGEGEMDGYPKVEGSPKEGGSPKGKSSPEGRGSKKRHKSHRSHRHSSRRHRHRSDESAAQEKRKARKERSSEDVEDGELEDGEIDDEPQVDDGPPQLSPQVPLREGSKDEEGESEEEETEKIKSPVTDKKAEGGSGEESDDKKRAKKRKHEKKKKKRESRPKEKSKKRRPKYTDHDNVAEDGVAAESWMRRSRSPSNGHHYKGHDRYPLDRSPPGPYDSPYESPPGPYDSPSDEEGYGPPSKMMRRDSGKHRMMDMLGPEYMDPLDMEGGEEEMYGRGRNMGRGKQKKMDKGRMFREKRPGRMENKGPGPSAQKCKFFMEGKCAKGHNCTFSHDFKPPRKTEVCKFYISDTCAKGKDCLYMHGDYPCKFYHKGLQCAGDKCKFSHDPLDEHTGPIFDKIRDEDQDFVTVMLQQTNQLPYPLPTEMRNSPQKNNRRPGGNFQGPPDNQQLPPQHLDPYQQQQQQFPPQQQQQQQMYPRPGQEPPSNQHPDQDSDLKKIPSLFEIQVFPPPKEEGEEGGDTTPCPQSPNEDSESMEQGEGKGRTRGRENSPPHQHQGPHGPQMGGPMGGPPPHMGGGGMGGPPPHMGGPPPPHMGGPPPPHMGGPPPMGMRPRFYADMNAGPGRPPMMGGQAGVMGAGPHPSMLRPPPMNFPHPGDPHLQGGPPGEYYEHSDTILSPEPEKYKDVFGLDDQLREMREMSGALPEDGSGGGPPVTFPAHLPAKQRELFRRIQNQQRKNVPEPASNNDQGDKLAEDDNWYSSDEEESGPPKANLANILKKLNQNAPPSTQSFDLNKVLDVIQGANQPSQPGSQSRDPRQSMKPDPRVQRPDPRTAQRQDPRDQRPDPRLDHRGNDPRMREPPTIPMEKTTSHPPRIDDSRAGGDSRFNEHGIHIHRQIHGDMGEIPYQLHKMTISQPTIPHHVNPSDPKYREDPRIQRQTSGRGYKTESRPVRRPSTHSDPRAPQQQGYDRYDSRAPQLPNAPGMRTQDPRMARGGSGGGGSAFKQDVDMRQERRPPIQDPRMSRSVPEAFDMPHHSLQNPPLPTQTPQDMDMRTMRLPLLNSGARDSPPMPSLPPFIPPKPTGPLHKTHSSSPTHSPRGDSGNSSSDDKSSEKPLSHRNDPRFRKKPKTDSGSGASGSSPQHNDRRQRTSDPRRAFEHRSPLDSGGKSGNEPSFGSFNPGKNSRDDSLRHGDKDERDFNRGGNNGFQPRHGHSQPPRGPARHLGMPQISMPTRLSSSSSLRPSSPNPAQLVPPGPMVRTGGPTDGQLADDDPNRSMKEVFKTIDPTASPFC